MRIRSDGSIQSSATPTPDNTGRKEDFAMYRCMVTKVIYVDDPANLTTNAGNPRVLYDVVVLGGFAAGQVISNCRLASDLGGNMTFYERILKASSQEAKTLRLSDADGDIVYVQFIQGHTGYPVIIALDNGISTGTEIGSKIAEGPRSVRQYNGVKEEINKDGEWSLSRKGGTATPETGSFTPAEETEVTLKLAKDEAYTRTYKSGLSITEDGKNDKTTQTHKGGLTETKDGTADKITRTLKGGLSITEDGKSDKVTIATASGVSIEVDGQNNKITLTKGSTIIELDGAADKISLKGGFVDLGSSVSDFAVLFGELLTTFNSHTHNAPQAPSGTLPTTPPIAPMLSNVGSTTVKVQP